MMIKRSLKEDQGVVSIEYVIFVAIAAVLLSVGAWVLYDAMRDLFAAWAGYFGAS